MKKADLKSFFKQRPAISQRLFFIEAGYSQGKWPINYLMDETERDVPPGILEKITPLLKTYGHDS